MLEREGLVPQNAYFFKAGSEGVDWGSRKFGVKIGGIVSIHMVKQRALQRLWWLPPAL